MKLFLACKIDVSDNYIAVINSLKHLLRHDSISWADPLNAHLTIKFFGETPDFRVDKIDNILKNTLQKIPPFEISINKIGAFGSSYQPKIIWFGIAEEHILKNNHKIIMDNLKAIGYYPDAGNFVPHITLARITKTSDKKWFWKCIENYQADFIQKTTISEIYLLESLLLNNKISYRTVHKYQLSI